MAEEYKHPNDLIRRGVKEPSPLGTATFIGLRSLDPLWQYQILRHGVGASLLHKLGFNTLPAGMPTQTGIALIDKLELSPYRLILLSMAAGSAIKQIFWLTVTSQEEFGAGPAVAVSIYNTVINSINSLLFTSTLASASLDSDANFPQWPLLIGSAMYVVGILTETVAEVQRSQWKKKPENKGKVYTGGLWSITRHINYTGYTLWRSGYALAGGGWIWAGIMTAWQVYDFTQRSIPVLDDYCTKRVSVKPSKLQTERLY